MSAEVDAVTLGPFRYRVSTDPAEWDASKENPDGGYGHTDHRRGVILIHEDASDDMRRVVLLHELMHAAAFAAGQVDNRKRKEEDWVAMVAPMLLDALQRSPELVAYLCGSATQSYATLIARLVDSSLSSADEQ